MMAPDRIKSSLLEMKQRKRDNLLTLSGNITKKNVLSNFFRRWFRIFKKMGLSDV